MPDINQSTDVAAALINLSRCIGQVPEPHVTELRACYHTLSETILNQYALLIQRDQVVLKLVEQARIDTKYINFDLEATTRERDQLQRQIDDFYGIDDEPP